MSRENDRRIARNTVFLYIRMLLTMGVSLYTSRVVLEVLGVADYGVYNVVGGLVVMLSFLNGTMSGATQRFMNFEMGRGVEGRLRETFASAWVIHVSIAAVLLVVGETAGLWFVNNILVIDETRMHAAYWTYQYSLFGSIFAVLLVPFNGAIFAHERMNVYAYITLLFTFLKLGVALLLLYVASADTLVTYSALILCVNIVNFLCYYIYCLRNFKECRMSFKAPVSQIKAMLVYSGSDLIGTACYTIENQGVLVILNRIGGTTLNAAGGLCMTVCSAVSQFGSSIVMAFRPQIIKQYAAGDYSYMQTLMVNCSKYAILLLSVFAIPVFVEMDYLLALWLKEVPDYTALFCRLALLMAVSQMTVYTLNAGIHATGKIFKFSAFTGLSYIVELPVMYILMRWTDNPAWAYIVPIFQMMFNVLLISVMLRDRMPEFAVRHFLISGYLSPVAVVLAVGSAVYYAAQVVPDSFLRVVVVGLISILLLLTISWTVLLTPRMRREVAEAIKKKLNR
ncbi:MAG: hypothetical protein K2L77_07660 [Muribaculaceae bacterium]|nr:hypothetical protein [Muribaculaceae bacterium]